MLKMLKKSHFDNKIIGNIGNQIGKLSGQLASKMATQLATLKTFFHFTHAFIFFNTINIYA